MPVLAEPEIEAVLNATGRGVRVLVVDSGVEVAHPVFAGRTIASFSCDPSGPGWEVRPSKGTDSVGHGTACAGIIATHAPGARIDSLAVLGGDALGTSERVLAGLRWGIEQDYDILNCSLGTPESRWTSSYKSVVDLAFCKNVLLIGACSNRDFRETSLPSTFPSVLSTDRGPGTPLSLQRRPGHLVEFIAYGENVRVPWSGHTYCSFTGTSFAAPHLAALVARIRELRPKWNACEIKAFLYRYCSAIAPMAAQPEAKRS